MKASSTPSSSDDAQFHYQRRHDRKSSHHQIASLILRRPHGPILDVGAAQGILARLLHEKNPAETAKLVLDAVEPDEDWSREAAPYYRRVFNSSVEEAALPFGEYRVVVCADVLEHVVDPVRVLQCLRRAATPDARFIISLPNVAHLAIRLLLLSGQFPKMEKGILDRTHLHFYTRQTAQEMLESAGLRVERILPTVVPLEIWFPDTGDARRPLYSLLKQGQYSALHIAPRLFAYQWIFVARPLAELQNQPPGP